MAHARVIIASIEFRAQMRLNRTKQSKTKTIFVSSPLGVSLLLKFAFFNTGNAVEPT